MRAPQPSCLVVALMLGAILPAPTVAGEGSETTAGEVTLAPGLTAVFDDHFDHNAFAASVDAPGGLVALTRSGNLLRFDRDTLRRGREWFGPSRATCLGPGEGGSALVGFEDGRVARLDPASLGLTFVATLPGKVHWVGHRPGGIVAVVERWKWADEPIPVIGPAGSPPGPAVEEWRPYSEIHDLGPGRSFAVDRLASAVFLDGRGRAWLGGRPADPFRFGWIGGRLAPIGGMCIMGGQGITVNGPGGPIAQTAGLDDWCCCLDLATGQARPIPGIRDPATGLDRWDRILGFLERPDGQVWAFGGDGAAFIRRADGARAGDLAVFEEKVAGEPIIRAVPGRPRSPIFQIVPELGTDSLLVATRDCLIFRADSTLGQWEELHSLDIRNEWDDRGSPIVALHPRYGPGDDLLFATRRDGYVLLSEGRETRDILPDQLEADETASIEANAEGIFFGGRAWSTREGRWKAGRPFGPRDQEIADPATVFAGPTGSAFAISDRRTARWRGDDVEVIGEGLPAALLIAAFETPDGQLWAIARDEPDRAAARNRLKRLDGGRWATVADLPGVTPDRETRVELLEGNQVLFEGLGSTTRLRRADGLPIPVEEQPGYGIGGGLRIVNPAGPPWILFDQGEEQLLALDIDRGRQAPRLARLPIEEGGRPIAVHDAIAWTHGELLLATRKGLMVYDVATGRHRPAPLPSPDRIVRRLARDGLNRIWLGGEGIWMVDADGRRLHDLAALPMVGRSGVSALAADPARRDGVVVSLGVRGVAFIRVEVGP